MDRFIHEQNLAHYRKILAETTDPAKRQTVLKLLADEQANLQPPPQKQYGPPGQAILISVNWRSCGWRYQASWRTLSFDAPEPA
jgi:hypothetical protein